MIDFENGADELVSGLYQRLTFAEYANMPAVNNGAIGYGMLSMRHMRAYLRGEISTGDSTARKFGRAAHTRIFEPEKYSAQVLVASPCVGIYRSGKNKGSQCSKAGKYRLSAPNEDAEWFCGQHKQAGSEEPENYVTAEEAGHIEQMAESLKRHEVGKDLLLSGMSEVSIIWKHKNIWCKGRVDRLVHNQNSSRSPVIYDLKKCQVGKANQTDAERSILNYGWHRQAAMYRWGLSEILGVSPAFAWIFVEDSPPYDVYVMRCDEETLKLGHSEIQSVLNKWSEAVITDKYPGRYESVHNTGGLPEYARPITSMQSPS